MKMEKLLTKQIIDEINNCLIEVGEEIKTTNLKDSYNYLINNGGKRFRPLITSLSCAMFSSDIFAAINQGTAVELLHNFTLVHDDIMDKSPLRRGKETIYQKWDDTTAILLGDLILGLSYKLLVKNLDAITTKKVIDVFNSGLVEVCLGQGYDLEFESHYDINIAEYEMMIEKKTSSLIKTSLLLGGIIGGANEDEIEKLSLLGSQLGKAFQLQDDLLDITGEAKHFGKKIGQDIIEGKKTYLIIKAKEKATKPEHKRILEKFYNNSGLNESEVVSMKQVFDELGVIKKLQTLIDDKFEYIFKMINDIRSNDYSNSLILLLKQFSKREV